MCLDEMGPAHRVMRTCIEEVADEEVHSVDVSHVGARVCAKQKSAGKVERRAVIRIGVLASRRCKTLHQAS